MRVSLYISLSCYNRHVLRSNDYILTYKVYVCISFFLFPFFLLPSSFFLQVLRSKDVLDLKLSLSDSLNAMSDQVGLLHGDIIPRQPTKPQIAHAGPYSITIRWTKNPSEDEHLEVTSYDVQWRLASSVVTALERGRATVKKGEEHMIAYEKVRTSLIYK